MLGFLGLYVWEFLLPPMALKVSQIIQRPKHQKSVRDQFDGRTNVERYHPILRVRRRAPKGPMLEHLVQEAGREPMYYILQLYAKGRVASKAHHRAGRIVFFYP